MPATARVADPEERAQLWPLVNRTNRGMSRLFHPGVTGRYDVYQRHTARTIPVVIITPDRRPRLNPGDRPTGPGRLRPGSVEQVGLLPHDAVEEGLEAEPAGQVGTDLAWP